MLDWSDFYVAVAGATAALTGLIFVGVSISLAKILSLPALPDRALLSLVLLLNVLLLSLLSLVPGQATAARGLELVLIGLLSWGLVLFLDLRNLRARELPYRVLYGLNIFVDQLATIPFVVAGVLLLLGVDGAPFWMVPAVLLSIVKGLIDAWVLLVEIHR